MKKLILLLILATGFVSVKATHNLGGEITYRYIGANSYEITAKLYTDCQGVPPGSSISVNYSSASCSINQFVALGKVYSKDISQVCDTMLLACNGGSLPGVFETMYQGTIVVMPPCNDWVLSYDLCCRGMATNTNTPSANFYIETRFDNTVFINESPYFADSPRWMIPVNGASLINAGAYDADGDSLYYSLVAPKASASSNLTYAAGYSANQPFGPTATSIDSKTGIISTLGQQSGQFLIAVQVDEYRNGQLISSTIRDFTTNVYVDPDPLPEITNASLNISGCTVDTVSLDIYSSDGNDTITTSILYPFAPGNIPVFSNLISAPFNTSTDYLLDTNTLSWDLNGLDPNREYIVYINVEENTCPISHIQSYAVVVSTSYCVWPGDANNDLIADVWDVLPIGVFNATTGSVRPNASLNWEGQWSPNWGTNQASGDDIKHVDCNGDATIDANDTTAILLNYNLTHTKSNSGIGGINDPDLYVDIALDTVSTSTPLAIPVKLGTSTLPADSVYGIAMSISYDKTKIDSIAGVTVDYSNSWLGTKGVDLITLDTNFYDNGQIDIALVRNDGQMMNGFGEVLTLNVITIDNLSGKGASYGTLPVDFIKVTIIDNKEGLRAHNQLPDSVVIKDITSGIGNVIDENSVKILPNPNNGNFKIFSANSDVSFEIYSLSGQLVNSPSSFNNGYYTVNMSEMPKGLYIVKFYNDNDVFIKKVIIN